MAAQHSGSEVSRGNLLNKQLVYLGLSLMTLALLPARTVAWGNDGHQIIAQIAAERLSSDTRRAINELLPKGETLESISTWADQMKLQRPDTRGWHFVDIPLGDSNYDYGKDCGTGKTCIIEAIQQQIKILRNSNNSPSDRADALRFLVHLLGDLHQPFHVTTNTNPNDQAANLVKVKSFNGRITSLHALWDDDIIKYALGQSKLTVPDYAAQLSKKAWANYVSTRGSVTDWALETHRLAWGAYVPSGDYFMIADGKLWILSDDYFQQNRPVVERQLINAGIRLAKTLNDIFG